MATKKVAESFVKQFMAVLKGDTDEVVAQKVYRQANAALEAQIACLKGDTIAKEEALENAKENLENARVNNGCLIINRNAYVENLVQRKNHYEDKKEELELHLETLSFLESELKAINA